eukprot:788556-Alexandrium_andersonii.AAC.1
MEPLEHLKGSPPEPGWVPQEASGAHQEHRPCRRETCRLACVLVFEAAQAGRFVTGQSLPH